MKDVQEHAFKVIVGWKKFNECVFKSIVKGAAWSAAWFSGGQPWLRQQGWDWMIFEVPLTQAVLWFTQWSVCSTKDTIEVVMFNPHETNSSMCQNRRKCSLFFLFHKDWHKMLHLRHVHIPTVIPTDENLQEEQFLTLLLRDMKSPCKTSTWDI